MNKTGTMYIKTVDGAIDSYIVTHEQYKLVLQLLYANAHIPFNIAELENTYRPEHIIKLSYIPKGNE